MLVPNRSACAFMSVIRSGPVIPLGNPGKFSTSVVVVSWPPCSLPAIMSVFKNAREVYTAAVYPAGPLPIMITSYIRSIY